jgi:hypothetical protein
MPIRVFLAWQVISDGRPQVRRWSPDLPGRFMGYQRRTAEVIAWLHEHGDPRWPDRKADGAPFEVIDSETGEVIMGEGADGLAA